MPRKSAPMAALRPAALCQLVLPLLALLVGPAAAGGSGEAGYTLVYTAGHVSHVTFQGDMDVARAQFDAAGRLLAHSNRSLTSMDAFMMGYVRVAPSAREVVFAAQTKNATSGRVDPNVGLFRMAIAPSVGAPRPLLPDGPAPLLAPCRAATPPCTQVDLFHPAWDDTTGGRAGLIAFGYRAWTVDGLPAGNQALALLEPGSGAVRLLTFNASDIQGKDECPRFVPGTNGTQLLFLRNAAHDGDARVLAHLDVRSGRVTTLYDAPTPDEFMGCPAHVGNEFLYITSSSDDGLGSGPSSSMVAVTVEATSPEFRYTVAPRFPVPRINNSLSTGALSIQYCSAVSPAPGGKGSAQHPLLACLGGGMSNGDVALVDAATGERRANMSVPLPPDDNWCMTANSFHVLALGD